MNTITTVLIVEDDYAIRLLVAELLHDEGYSVLEAQNGAQAIYCLDQPWTAAEPLSAIILDMMMPKGSGVEVLRYLQQHGLSTPVIAVSASPYELNRATAAGARVTLAKPFELDQLLGTVERCCIAFPQ